MKKILAVIVNYGDEQLNYLEQVVHELKSFKIYKNTSRKSYSWINTV
jgi:hypothetical protein